MKTLWHFGYDEGMYMLMARNEAALRRQVKARGFKDPDWVENTGRTDFKADRS